MSDPADRIVYKTADFDVVVYQSIDPALPPEMRLLYAIIHRDTAVVHTRSNNFAATLYYVEDAQKTLRRAILDPKTPPEQELNQFQRAALLGALETRGGGN